MGEDQFEEDVPVAVSRSSILLSIATSITLLVNPWQSASAATGLGARIGDLTPVRSVDDGEAAGPVVLYGYEVLDGKAVDFSDDRMVVKGGDRISLRLHWSVRDRATGDLSAVIRSGSVLGAWLVRDTMGRPVQEWRIGEANTQDVVLLVKPSYGRGRPPAFFGVQRNPVLISYGYPGQDHGDVSVGSLGLAAEVQIPRGSLCLSGNPDIPAAKRVNRIRSIRFPTGEPSLGHGARDIRQELTDGIFSGSGNSNWESVFWGTGDSWGSDQRDIIFEFDKDVLLEGVVVVFDSPYPNFRVDLLSVTTSLDGDRYRAAGMRSASKSERGLSFLPVLEIGRRTRFVRLILSHEADATTLPVSEVFLFGIPTHAGQTTR